jgi:hypothetical protein
MQSFSKHTTINNYTYTFLTSLSCFKIQQLKNIYKLSLSEFVANYDFQLNKNPKRLHSFNILVCTL